MAETKRNTVKIVFGYLLTAGFVAVAATNPRFSSSLLRGAMWEYNRKNKFRKNNNQNFTALFSFAKIRVD